MDHHPDFIYIAVGSTRGYLSPLSMKFDRIAAEEADANWDSRETLNSITAGIESAALDFLADASMLAEPFETDCEDEFPAVSPETPENDFRVSYRHVNRSRSLRHRIGSFSRNFGWY